jgi:hypothetical protein
MGKMEVGGGTLVLVVLFKKYVTMYFEIVHYYINIILCSFVRICLYLDICS